MITKYLKAYTLRGSLSRKDFMPIFFIDLALWLMITIVFFWMLNVYHPEVWVKKILSNDEINIAFNIRLAPNSYQRAYFLYLLWSGTTYWPQVRRLRDLGKSGFYVLLMMPVPPVFLYKWYLLLFKEGKNNQPKAS